MAELREFLHMGGYAAYVWTSYALTTIVLGGIVWWSTRELRHTRSEVLRRARVTRRESRVRAEVSRVRREPSSSSGRPSETPPGAASGTPPGDHP